MTTVPDLNAELDAVAEHCDDLAQSGVVADYLPQLADADPDQLGVALADLDGHVEEVGDAHVAFPIQSISKVFALALAMEHVGDDIWERVGREPSGDPFNSLVQLEHERGIPRNPMINAGALVIDDLLAEHRGDPTGDFRELMTELAGSEVGLDRQILDGEAGSGFRNRAMANLMRAFDNLTNPVDDVMAVYMHQCSVTMTCVQLATATRFLANDGIDPASGRQIVSAANARRINAIMLTCGTYDAAGDFAFRVGIPCKSGVAGGIIGVAPRQMGICVFSPGLDATGNSLRGQVALERLAADLDLSVF